MVEPSGPPDIKIMMYSQPRLLSGTRAMISNLAERLGFNDVECGQISLAVDEALCNVINHGYDKRPDGRIWISVWGISEEPPSIRVVLEDHARQVEEADIKPRDLDDIRPGGLGVHLMRQIMDVVQYEKRNEGGMKLIMSKRKEVDESPSFLDEFSPGQSGKESEPDR
jgi:sigma-B regulation protein RsbU (phosphoserine phosphatase)